MQMGMSYVIAVVITGLIVVFLGLVLLIAFISAIGAIFKKIDQQKAAAKAAETAEKSAEAPKAVVKPVAAAPASD
ncbi:MAG: OadG family protein, partial [Oscillospiraceae bacterium]|nr:OadG family protein [Oscillospiraceae bacterium]